MSANAPRTTPPPLEPPSLSPPAKLAAAVSQRAQHTPGGRRLTVAVLILAPIIAFYVSLFVGRFGITPLSVVQILVSRVLPGVTAPTDPSTTVVLDVRLPRVLLAMLAGADLAITGAAFQGMFRNPLVSPDILGVSAAAGFGAALAILLSASSLLIQLSAFGFGILGVAMTYSISRVYRTTPVVLLILGGVVVAAFFNALVSVTK